MLESKLPSDEKELKQKLYNQQKNMEQLTLMYHSLGSQKKLLDINNKVLDKKLKRRNEQMKDLEKKLMVTTEQIMQQKQHIKDLIQIIKEKMPNNDINPT